MRKWSNTSQVKTCSLSMVLLDLRKSMPQSAVCKSITCFFLIHAFHHSEATVRSFHSSSSDHFLFCKSLKTSNL